MNDPKPGDRVVKNGIECSSPTLALSTLKTEQSTDIPTACKDATNLIRALESIHPRNTESASSGDAFITNLSLLFDCSEQRARKLAPLVLETMKISSLRKRTAP